MPRIHRTVAIAMAAVALAQTLSFEVASVKPSPPPNANHDQHIDRGLFSVKGTPLRGYIMMAYGIRGQFHRIAGGPTWTETEPFDIDARAEAPSSMAEMMVMLQSLLAERFQLKLHRETRPILVNVLVAAKGGPRFGPDFHEVKDGETFPDPGKPSLEHMVFPGAPFKTFVDRLGLWMHRDPATGLRQDVLPILDETRLAGRYYIVFNALSEEDWSATLERQLGLRLEQRKVPTEVIVVDSAVRPSAN